GWWQTASGRVARPAHRTVAGTRAQGVLRLAPRDGHTAGRRALRGCVGVAGEACRTTVSTRLAGVLVRRLAPVHGFLRGRRADGGVGGARFDRARVCITADENLRRGPGEVRVAAVRVRRAEDRATVAVGNGLALGCARAERQECSDCHAHGRAGCNRTAMRVCLHATETPSDKGALYGQIQRRP